MEKEKMNFSSVHGAYNKSYKESDLVRQVANLQDQIEALQLKLISTNPLINIL